MQWKLQWRLNVRSEENNNTNKAEYLLDANIGCHANIASETRDLNEVLCNFRKYLGMEIIMISSTPVLSWIIT